jgi:hypothetical protein
LRPQLTALRGKIREFERAGKILVVVQQGQA